MMASSACYCSSPHERDQLEKSAPPRFITTNNKKAAAASSSLLLNATTEIEKEEEQDLLCNKTATNFDDEDNNNVVFLETTTPLTLLDVIPSINNEEEEDVYWHENACFSEKDPSSFCFDRALEETDSGNNSNCIDMPLNEDDVVIINNNNQRRYAKNIGRKNRMMRRNTVPPPTSASLLLTHHYHHHHQPLVLAAVLEQEDEHNNTTDNILSRLSYVDEDEEEEEPPQQLHHHHHHHSDSQIAAHNYSSSSRSSSSSTILSSSEDCAFLSSSAEVVLMASSDVVAAPPINSNKPPQASLPSSPPMMRSRPRLPAISYINRAPQQQINHQQHEQILLGRPLTSSPAQTAGLIGNDPFLSSQDGQTGQQSNMSVLKSDFAQKYRRPLVSPVRAQTQLQACSPPPVALQEHLANKQRRKLSSPLIFRPINDGYPVQDSTNTSNNNSAAVTTSASFTPNMGTSGLFDQPSMASMSLLGPMSTTTSSTTSSSSRETIVPLAAPLTPQNYAPPPQQQQQQFLQQQQQQQMPSSSSSSSSPQSQQQGDQQSAQHVSRRIKSLADRLRGNSFESPSPESKNKQVLGGDLVESSSSEEQQRVLSLQNDQQIANKRPRSQSPRVTLSQQNKQSPNSLSGGNVHTSLSSSMESQGFSEALTTSTDSAGSATQTMSTAGTASSASGTMTTRATMSSHGGPGSVASTVVSNSSTVVRHSSLRQQPPNPARSDSHSPAADSSTGTGEYNVSGAEDTSRRQSLMTGAISFDFQPNATPPKPIEPPSRISTLTRRKPRLDIFGLDLLAKRGSVDTFMKKSDENISELSPPAQTSRRPSRSHQAAMGNSRFLTHPIAKAEATPASPDDQSSPNQLNSDSQIASQSPTMTGIMQASLLSEQSASCGNVDELALLMPGGDNEEQMRHHKISSSGGSFQVDFLSDQDELKQASGESTSPSNNHLSTSPSGFVQASSASVEFISPNSLLRAEDQFGQIHMTSRRGGSKKQRRHQQQQQQQHEHSVDEQQLMREISPSSIAAAATTTERREAMAKLHSQSGAAAANKITPAISPAPAPTAVSSRLAEIFGTSRSTVVNATAAFHRPPTTAAATGTRTTSASSMTPTTPLAPTNVTSASVLQTSMTSLHSQQSGESEARQPASRQVSTDLLEAQEANLRGVSPNKEAAPPPPQQPQAAVPKRKLIVDEFYSVEKEYVEALKILVEKYLTPLKAQDVLETPQVDDIFYKIPEFYAHHSIFLTFLEKAWKNWHDLQTIGDIINMIFSKESVIECYMSFIENYSRSEKALESALQTNSAFKKFIDVRQRESRTKLDLKSLIIQPAQRLPRYLLLLKRLIGNTNEDHPDYKLLALAEKTIHNLAEKIEQSKKGESLLDTLRRIEQTLLPDQQLCSPERYYIRQDMVQIQGRKEQSCIWLFSDLAIFSTYKRKGGASSGDKRKSILLNTPFGQDFVDFLKHKTWLRIGLDDLELKMVQPNALKKSTPEQAKIEADMQVLQQIIVLLRQLSADQNQLSEQVNELLQNRNRQLVDITNRSQQSLMELATLDLIATTPQGEFVLTIGFINPEKRQSFETAFLEARQRLSATSGRRVPQFIHYLPVMKIRQGMTFSFCAATEDFNNFNCRDVWIVNSDGYLDNVCQLTLQPEPNISQNTPLSGCSGQIYCICAVPAATNTPGQRDYGGRSKTAMPGIGLIKAAASTKESSTIGEESDTESSGQSEGEDDEIRQQKQQLLAAANLSTSSSSAGSQLQPGAVQMSSSSSDLTSKIANPILDGSRATVWFGTEDGIYIFGSQDNIRTTKNRARIPLSAACLAIVYVDNKVFASLSNGDIVLIRREPRSFWEVTKQTVIPPLGTTVPASRLTVVTGNIWCARQNLVHVLDPVSLAWQHTFQISPDLNRSVTAMAPCGHTVWVATQNSDKLMLYHANSKQVFLEVCVMQSVAQKLSAFDDIIRQHKLACLHVTSLYSCKDLLWVGTSAGVILTITSPRLGSTTPKGPIPPPVITPLNSGHAGQVRVLIAIEMPILPNAPKQPATTPKTSSLASLAATTVSSAASLTAPNSAPMGRRLSTTSTATMATKMLVLSGGEGYENLQNPTSPGEDGNVGKEDNTNHILLWEV